jgi:hypothetical protein
MHGVRASIWQNKLAALHSNAFTKRRGHAQNADADPDDLWGMMLPASPRLAPAKPLPSMLLMLCYDFNDAGPSVQQITSRDQRGSIAR